MISADIALPPDAVAYVPPAPPYVVAVGEREDLPVGGVVPVTRLAYCVGGVVVHDRAGAGRCRRLQPPQKPMLQRGVASGEVRSGSQLTPDSPRDDLDPVDVDVVAVGLERLEGEQHVELRSTCSRNFGMSASV